MPKSWLPTCASLSLLLAASPFAAGCGESTAKRVARFGPVAVGEVAPAFAAQSIGGVPFRAAELGGTFRAFYVSGAMPSACLDEECGKVGRDVVARGGHFVGTCDERIAQAFGVGAAGKSLLVVTDGEARVVAIYDGVADADVRPLLAAAF